MPTIETSIDQALRARVATLAGGYVIDYGDTDFTPPVASGKPVPWLEYRNRPNTVDRILITSTGAHDRPGVLQLSLCYPVALNHTQPVIIEKAGLIAAHFPCDLKLTQGGVTTRIDRAPTIIAPDRQGAYWRVPVIIRWRTFA